MIVLLNLFKFALFANTIILVFLSLTYFLVRFYKNLEFTILKLGVSVYNSRRDRIFIQPALFFDKIFDYYFGTRIISRTSFKKTLYISLFANLWWLLLILIDSTAEADRMTFAAFSSISLNIIIFSICNLFGDFISICITRKIIKKIIETKRLKYLLFDFFGVIVGYFITIFINVVIIFSIDSLGILPEHWFNMGVLGTFLSTYVLTIFVASGKFWISFFGAFSNLYNHCSHICLLVNLIGYKFTFKTQNRRDGFKIYQLDTGFCFREEGRYSNTVMELGCSKF